MAPLSIWDRIVFGSISGLFGGVLGAVAAFCIAIALDSPAAPGKVIGFSVVYFFCIGAVRGPDAGFFVGEAFSAIGAIGMAEAGVVPGEGKSPDQPRGWRSVWLLAAWLAVACLLT